MQTLRARSQVRLFVECCLYEPAELRNFAKHPDSPRPQIEWRVGQDQARSETDPVIWPGSLVQIGYEVGKPGKMFGDDGVSISA